MPTIIGASATIHLPQMVAVLKEQPLQAVLPSSAQILLNFQVLLQGKAAISQLLALKKVNPSSRHTMEALSTTDSSGHTEPHAGIDTLST
jgi:hypothetical protein